MKVEYGTLQDIESWMQLVQRVRWNFPGLETAAALDDHRKTVLRFMSENRALCVKDAEKVVGVLLLSKKHNMICCLAVAPEYRRNGIASALLEKALAELDSSRDITVTTFRENDEKGIAPRALYIPNKIYQVLDRFEKGKYPYLFYIYASSKFPTY